MGRSSNAINNLFFGFILRFVTMVGPFVVRVIITRTIGREFLGVSGVFSSVLSALALTELGFASAISYKCYGLYAKNDYPSMRRYLSFFKKVYRIVGTVIISLGILLIPFLKYIVNENFLSGLNMYIIYLVYLFNAGISYFIGAYKTIILTASQRQDIESRIAIFCNSFMYIMQIIVLVLFRDYYVYLIFIPISTVLINIFRIRQINSMFPELYADGMISQEERKSIYQSIIPLMGHRLHGTIVISADNIVISEFIGVAMVAEYNNYYTIITALGSFVITIYAAIQPGLGNSMALEGVEKNYTDFKKISFAIMWIIGWMSICLSCLFEDFIEIAYGGEYMLGISTVVLLAVEFYIWHTFDIVMTYRDVVGSWSGDMIVPYISGAFNLFINILLVKQIGVNGVIISTILSFVVVSIPFSVKVLFSYVFKISGKEFLTTYFLHTTEIIIVGCFTYFLCGFLQIFSPIIRFVIKGVICLIFPNLVFYMLWAGCDEFKYFKYVSLNHIKHKSGE